MRTTLKTASCYAVCFVAIYLTCHIALMKRLSQPRPGATGRPVEKLAHYQANKTAYDTLFVGDSRTYCNVHPHLLDPLLGTKSYNMAVFAHWFPTQFPFWQQLVPELAAGTTVVWSIGHQNFVPIHDTVNNSFPIGWHNAIRYQHWGYRLSSIWPNLNHYSTGIWAQGLRQWVESLSSRTLWGTSPAPTAKSPLAGAVLARMREYESAPYVYEVTPLRDAETKQVTALVVITNEGSYVRVELDKPYFRRKQAKDAEKRRQQPKPDVFTPDRARWQTFLAVLELCRQHDVRLIVNEMEEAPQVYVHAGEREMYRAFMRTQVQSEVEKRGFVYARIDHDQLRQADYFDYNHLNATGVARFSPLLAAVLKPHIADEQVK